MPCLLLIIATACSAEVGIDGSINVEANAASTFAQKMASAKRLHDDNAARCAALRAAPSMKKRKTYVTPVVDNGAVKFQIREDVTETPVPVLLAAWRPPVSITAVHDLFNDKLDYQIDTWQELEQLNAGMLKVMAKYEALHQESATVTTAIAAFLGNYRSIASTIATMESTAAGDASVVSAATSDFAAVAERAAAIAAKHGVIVTAPPPTVVATPPQVPPLSQQHFDVLKEALRASGIPVPAFSLLYRATVNGATTSDLLRAAEGKGPALVVAKAAEGGWLYGGYMDCGIKSGAVSASAPQSFVFSLTNPHGLPAKVWRRGSHSVGVSEPLSWSYTLTASSSSVLQWMAQTDAAPFAYEPRAPHGSKMFTNQDSWQASDVWVFRV